MTHHVKHQLRVTNHACVDDDGNDDCTETLKLTRKRWTEVGLVKPILG